MVAAVSPLDKTDEDNCTAAKVAFMLTFCYHDERKQLQERKHATWLFLDNAKNFNL
jgi:hypothetical protein